jgi:hypothetical protein
MNSPYYTDFDLWAERRGYDTSDNLLDVFTAFFLFPFRPFIETKHDRWMKEYWSDIKSGRWSYATR